MDPGERLERARKRDARLRELLRKRDAWWAEQRGPLIVYMVLLAVLEVWFVILGKSPVHALSTPVAWLLGATLLEGAWRHRRLEKQRRQLLDEEREERPQLTPGDGEQT